MLNANDLHKAWDRSGRFLSPHSRMRLTEDGLTLGADTVIVPLGRDDWERPVLEIEGNEERILALLSVAHEQPVSPNILGNLQNASRCLCKGELALAYIHLAFTGLQPLEDPDAPRRLFMAEMLLDHGMDEAEMLKGLGLFPRGLTAWGWRQVIKEFDLNQARDALGRWVAEGEAAVSSAATRVRDAIQGPKAVGVVASPYHGGGPDTDHIISDLPPKMPSGSRGSSQTAADRQGRAEASSPAPQTVTRPNGATVTHQPGGDWVVSNYERVTAIASDPAGGYYGECVALVKQLTGMPETAKWRAGDAITGYGDPPLQPGTVIATMDKNGRYPQGNAPKHAAVFIQYAELDGKKGMYVYDQYKSKKIKGGVKAPGRRFVAFDNNKETVNNAYSYSVVTTIK